jgi:hypothetical protein
MQPYSIPTDDTSTADSYASSSPHYGDLASYCEESENERTDPDLLMRFNSLGLNDLDNEESKEVSGITPRRHASEMVPPKQPIKVRPKLSHGPLHLAESFKTPRNPRETYSSSKAVTSAGFGTVGRPPGLMPPTAQSQPLYTPYSANNLPQFVGSIPMCPVPQYYVCQPEIVPVPVMYGYIDYPKVPCKPEPRRFFSSKKQVYPLLTEPSTTTSTELSETTIMLLKEYEKSGDYKKLAGKIGNLAKLQSGSRFLQKQVEKAGSEFFYFILQEVTLLC